MKLKKSLAVVLTSAALFSMCTGTMVEASKKGSGGRKPGAHQSRSIKRQSEAEQRIVEEDKRLFHQYNELKKRREEILSMKGKKSDLYVQYLVERRRFQADLMQLEIDKTRLGISKRTDEDLTLLKEQARRVRREAKYIEWLAKIYPRDWNEFSRIVKSVWYKLEEPFIGSYKEWQKFLPAKIKKIREVHSPCLSWVTDDHKWNNFEQNKQWNNFEQNQRRITFNADFTQNNPRRIRVLQMDVGNHAVQTHNQPILQLNIAYTPGMNINIQTPQELATPIEPADIDNTNNINNFNNNNLNNNNNNSNNRANFIANATQNPTTPINPNSIGNAGNTSSTLDRTQNVIRRRMLPIQVETNNNVTQYNILLQTTEQSSGCPFMCALL